MAEETTTLKLPADLAAQLRFLAAARCSTLEDEIVSQLRNALIRFSEGGGGGAGGAGSGSSLFLTSPIIGLVEGLLTAETTVGEGMQHGNFGLGTLNHLDGELVVLDGVAYQQGAEGTCRRVHPSEKSPFMSLTRWQPEKSSSVRLASRLDWPGLLAELERHFPSPNIFYALRLEGRFESVRARSVRRQETDRPLAQVAKEQAVFDLGAGSGSLVGFWSPAYAGHSFTVPGFHLHYLSDDRKQGGHVLQAVLLGGVAHIQPLHHAQTDLPGSRAFMDADLSRDPAADLESAEK